MTFLLGERDQEPKPEATSVREVEVAGNP